MPDIQLSKKYAPRWHSVLKRTGSVELLSSYLKELKVSDPVEAYAHYLMNATVNGIGCDNDALSDSYMRIAKKLNVEGLIFIQLFGCHSISNCFTMLKEKIRRELEIPSIAINFNKIGENVEQVKTRLGAFMEMFK